MTLLLEEEEHTYLAEILRCEDTGDSHNASACPTGHLAPECPNHKTNCIIKPALLGMGTSWPLNDT